MTALQLRLVTGSVRRPGSSSRRAQEKEKEGAKGKRGIIRLTPLPRVRGRVYIHVFLA
jgi:hypothetical protein